MGKEKTDLVSLLFHPQQKPKRWRKRRKRRTTIHWLKKMCFHSDLLCVSLQQSPSVQPDPICVQAGASLAGAERTRVARAVCLFAVGSSGCWQSWGRVGFQVWSQENIPLMCTYLQCDTRLGSPSHRLERPPDLFPRKDCLHEILLGMNAVSAERWLRTATT